ncbi:MAG: ECF transporter S component [Oscillospiraceae bacterium]|nr:ECF transporter S component [Oscillospiraceae bacterium]
MNPKNTTQKIVTAAMFAALTCVATMIIKIPSPLNGYINIGDSIVLLAAWTLSPLYGFLAAGIGSALADILSGYIVYAPATFVIKGVMVLIAFYGIKIMPKKANSFAAKIVIGALAEIWMSVGYFLFEGLLYGFAPSAVNIPANCIQGVAGLVPGCALIKIFEKNKISFR